jgi:glycopeptide antibiotics resistance protein
MVFVHLRNSKKIMTVVFVTSLLLELIQLVLALGNFDVDDLLLNSIGGIAGYGVYLVFSPGEKNS